MQSDGAKRDEIDSMFENSRYSGRAAILVVESAKMTVTDDVIDHILYYTTWSMIIL